jgi:hypothetical protein
VGPISSSLAHPPQVRSTPINGNHQTGLVGPVRANKGHRHSSLLSKVHTGFCFPLPRRTWVNSRTSFSSSRLSTIDRTRSAPALPTTGTAKFVNFRSMNAVWSSGHMVQATHTSSFRLPPGGALRIRFRRRRVRPPSGRRRTSVTPRVVGMVLALFIRTSRTGYSGGLPEA